MLRPRCAFARWIAGTRFAVHSFLMIGRSADLARLITISHGAVRTDRSWDEGRRDIDLRLGVCLIG